MNHVQYDTVAVDMKQVTKIFGNLVANDKIDLTVHKGEVHALLGENGAGKTTLMNVLYGLIGHEGGEIYINGKQVHFKTPKEAIDAGLGMVHQHFMLVEPFTVTENIILGKEELKVGNVLDMAAARQKIVEISEKFGLKIDPDAKIQDISVGMQQRVEILKALYRGAEILILDEPTAVLTPQEIEELMEIIEQLTQQGKTIIIITHKLVEIKKCADYCTIVRRGRRINTVKVSEVTEDQLASMMVGREVTFKVKKEPANPGEVIVDIQDLWVKDVRGLDAVKGFNLKIRKGEIVGLAGVDGNGQSELIEAIVGLTKVKKGTISIHGKDVTHASIKERLEEGLGSIPQDRQKSGLILTFSIAENMILEQRGKEPFCKHGIMNQKEIISYTQKLIDFFDVRPNDPNHLAGQLSGGNQQKAIIARVIGNDPDFIIAAQPTRGLDVGAIESVHKALVDARDKGKAILLVSFELDEIMNVSDRIVVLYEGKENGEIEAEKADENTLGLWMAGGNRNE